MTPRKRQPPSDPFDSPDELPRRVHPTPKRSTQELAESAERAQRRKQVASLQLAGASPKETALQLGLSLPTVRKYLVELEQEAREDARAQAAGRLALELRRLDEIQKGIWHDAKTGKLGAVDRQLKLTETRAKLAGLTDRDTRIAKQQADNLVADALDVLTSTITDEYLATKPTAAEVLTKLAEGLAACHRERTEALGL